MPQLRPGTAKEKEVTRSHSFRLIASVSWEFGMGSLRLPWLSAGASRGDREILPCGGGILPTRAVSGPLG